MNTSARRLPAIEKLPPGLITLDDHERHARTLLDEKAWAWLAGGAGDETTLRANRESWTRLQLATRVLRNLAGGHTRVQLLGRTLAHPIMLAPVAYQRIVHPDGEIASAYAAASQGAGMVLSTQASVALEEVASAYLGEPSRGPLWFQLYIQHDRGFTRALAQRAEAAGFEALVVTVDAPCSGARDREYRSGFHVPAGVSAVNLAGLGAPQAQALAPQQSRLFDGLLSTAPSWEDIAWLKSCTRLPVLLKGVMHELDAREAIACGADGIIVSNHGGRTLDTVPPTSAVLSRIRAAAGQAFPLLVDGGVRRGTDVLKAIALGANAVLLGRPAVFGLANAGAVGVSHVLRVLRDELEIAMALCGCKTLADAGPELIFRG